MLEAGSYLVATEVKLINQGGVIELFMHISRSESPVLLPVEKLRMNLQCHGFALSTIMLLVTVILSHASCTLHTNDAPVPDPRT